MGTVVVPWYATGFRSDAFGEALGEIAKVALRYGAIDYDVYRARDDRYKFQQMATFEEYADWERYWEGPEMTYFRAAHSSWYQVPVVYGWWDRTVHGEVEHAAAGARAGDGGGNGTWGPPGESA
jgi:hypothetical protein